MGSDTLWGREFRAFSDLHWKMSDRCVRNIAVLIHTSEKVFNPDVSANSVLVFLKVAFLHLGLGGGLSYDTSSHLQFRHRKMSANMFSRTLRLVV